VDIFEPVRAVDRMADGVDWAGNPIGDPPAFLTGVAVNPNLADLPLEAERLRRKVDAGPRLVMAQVFFEWPPWERLLDLFCGSLPVPALVPVSPTSSPSASTTRSRVSSHPTLSWTVSRPPVRETSYWRADPQPQQEGCEKCGLGHLPHRPIQAPRSRPRPPRLNPLQARPAAPPMASATS